MIISRTPFRISFFGGGTDYPAWYLENAGQVLATTIDKYSYITCRPLPPFFEHKSRIVYSKIETVKDLTKIEHPAVRAVLAYLKLNKGLEIHYDGDLPARSGVGSSSAFTVGLLNALMALEGKYISQEELASQAITIEQEILRENVGSQDQICAAYGGFNRVEFRTDGRFAVSPVVLPESRLQEFQGNLMLYFTGLSRIASEIAKSKIDNFKNRGPVLKQMHEMVTEAVRILQTPNEPIEHFGKLLHENWLCKRSLSDMVSTSKIDELYTMAIEAGATGGKLLGAGGGGFLLLFVKPELQPQVRERLKQFLHVPFKFEHTGSRIVMYHPNGLG